MKSLMAVSILALAAAPVRGQQMGCGVMSGMTNYSVTGQLRANSPFTATLKTSFEQRLADGNTIRTETHTRQARDSAGRSMTEMVMGCERGKDGQMHEMRVVNVNDPVARTRSNWMLGGNGTAPVAHVIQVPNMPQPPQPRSVDPSQPPRVVPPPVLVRTPSPEQLARLSQMTDADRAADERNGIRNEDLGVKQIAGVNVHGTRSTRVIPAGAEGNDSPVVVINEHWSTLDGGLLLGATSDDPRHGRSTMECEELKLDEPDPALFVPPPGYTVQQTPTNAVLMQR